jgi:murein peptide amidase A
METHPTPPFTLTQHLLGQSVQGRPIVGYGGPLLKSPIKALWVAAFHGDEPQSAQLLDALLTQLPLAQHNVLVVPVFNPDGLAAQTRTNANGVDLNRNYPTTNFEVQGQGTPYYGGPHPASEPETQAMLALMAQWQPQAIVSVHTPYRVVNYDGPAQAMAATLSQHTGYPIEPGIGYPTPGSFGSWAGIERNLPIITLELPDTDPLAKIIGTNLPAFQALLVG